jgi:dolichol-phosphate mannosyltransferase
LTPRVSIVIPAYNEGTNILPVFDRIVDSVTLPFEVVVVYDQPEDTTALVIEDFGDARFRGVLNTLGPGPARAITVGIEAAIADVVVVTMADGSDDVSLVDAMTRLVERGCTVVAASRYMSGGAQVGAPLLKSMMSRSAGLILWHLARVGTHDATNSYKAYSKEFIEQVGIESDGGFEIAIELVAKARRLRRPIAELPTIWLERASGQSRFRFRAWLPAYLRWFRFAFGPRLLLDHVRSTTSDRPTESR